jgi:hypothetical protein
MSENLTGTGTVYTYEKLRAGMRCVRAIRAVGHWQMPEDGVRGE